MASDRITLEGMVFYGYHGAREEEKALGQRFVVDLELAVDLSRAGASDRLEDTVDYGEAYRLVKAVMEGPSKNLLESLAEAIGAKALGLPRVEEVRVTVKKPGVPIKGSVLSSAAVQITRGRSL